MSYGPVNEYRTIKTSEILMGATPPTVNAGPNLTATNGDTVTLSGATAANYDSLAWTCTSGQSPTFSDATALNPDVTFNETGSHTLQLTATNAEGSVPDTLTATVEAIQNMPPTANAGANQSVAAGANVLLDGSASSDPEDGGVTQYGWEQISGPSVTLLNANTASPSFTAPSSLTQQTLTFRLTTLDSEGLNATDTVDVVVAAIEENAILETMETADFELITQGDVTAYAGRANREVMRLKPSSTAGIITEDGFLDLTQNNIDKIEIIANGETISNVNSDSIKVDGTRLLPRLGDLPIDTGDRTSSNLSFTIVLYVGGDTRGLVVAASGTKGFKQLAFNKSAA